MLDIWGENIHNKKITSKSFLEGFQFVLKCPLQLQSCTLHNLCWSVRLRTVLGLYGYFLNVFLKILHTVPVDRFITVDTSEMDDLGFYSTRFLTVSMFSSIILIRGGSWSLEGETSPEAINLLITLEKALLRGSWRGGNLKCLRNILLKVVGFLNSP